MQNYIDFDENTTVQESRQMLLNNDMTAISNSSGVSFPAYAIAGTTCYRSDQDRLYIKRADGTWRMISDALGTALTKETADSLYAPSGHNHDTEYAPRTSSSRPGVTKLYRSDSDSSHNVQITWTGSYWRLYGYSGDTEHADVLVGRATTAATADNATKLGGKGTTSWMRKDMSQSMTGNLTVNGSITASSNITAYSDARIKDNIETLKDALGTVNRMRGVSYRNKTTNERGVGFIAQELNEVLPDVVVTNDNKMMSVAYGNITAVLVEAVKELSAKVYRLESQLSAGLS